MFARPRFPTAHTSDGSSRQSIMAHTMDGVPMAWAPRNLVDAVIGVSLLTATPIVAPHPVATLRVLP